MLCVSKREVQFAALGVFAPIISAFCFVVCVLCSVAFDFFMPVWLWSFVLQVVEICMYGCCYCFLKQRHSVSEQIFRRCALPIIGLYLPTAYLFYPMWRSFYQEYLVYAVANAVVFVVGVLIAVYILIQGIRKEDVCAKA